MAETEQITKRRVTMSDPRPVKGDDGQWLVPNGGPVIDYVRPDFLDAYVADARERWENVQVSDEPDAGPAGYHGPTTVPRHLDHELAGQTFAATTPTKPTTGGGSGSGKPASAFILSLQLQVVMFAAFAGWMLGAIQTVTQRNTLVTAYTGAVTHLALFSTVPGASAGTELTGGSPAYARKATGWSAASASASTTTVTFDVASGSTVAGFGAYTALTAGTYLDGASLTSQAFASQGTYALTATYTQS